MAGVTPHSRAAASLRELPNLILDHPEFTPCVDSLLDGKGATFDSVWGSSCALLAAALSKRFTHLLMVCPDSRSLDNHLDDLETFREGPAERLPTAVSMKGLDQTVDQEYGERLRMIKACAAGNVPGIVIASVQSLLQGVPTPASIQNQTKVIRKGETLDLESLHPWLLERGFHRTSAVELPGEYSVRGGIVDLFLPDWTEPVRLELFDNEVESLRKFSIGSQLSHDDLEQVEITLFTPGDRADSHFIDYLPAETLVLLVEPAELQNNARAFIERSEAPEDLHSWNEVRQRWAGHPVATANRLAIGPIGQTWKMPIEAVETFSGDISEIRLQIDRLSENGSFFAVARVEGEIARVKEILSQSKTAADGRLHLSAGCIHEGFQLRKLGLTVVGCDQLFHRTDVRRTRTRHRRLGRAIDSFMDLRAGDLVVHLSHGIARFRGLKMLEKDGQTTEHLELEFHGGTKIYVPASKIDLVQKYIGGTRTTPSLARIGGKAWVRQRQAAESAVADLAGEMIELQAARSSRPGIAFQNDTQWQSEFEQSFPYRETPDQLSAIESIKQDMQRPRPMDRLLCGDVGYGKTELAMRAAFKAVENGYQAALLVPTTILAEQHFRSFTERMGEFPLEICKLSRFCSSRELRQTVERLKSGQADIAIGTHRLVSKDVDFYNLGLVIIDEEQRFGVAHKERLKSLRSTVDVLTMSATPIPRTLHMSLVGVRDISNLETPPEERMPVETRVTRFDPELIRTAVLR
ncbi:MAG: DEAD/DEAH box helicase, partial [Planctomycetota bacterium]|nr:DEAD/DEAH box helicase [Planctomycetota bacterium]